MPTLIFAPLPLLAPRLPGLMQRRASAAKNRLGNVLVLQPLDLGGELAPLHGQIEQYATNLPIGDVLCAAIAFQRIGPAVFFGHGSGDGASAPAACIERHRQRRFALDQVGR
jgi:hypothetical protein